MANGVGIKQTLGGVCMATIASALLLKGQYRTTRPAAVLAAAPAPVPAPAPPITPAV